ncbi:MAG TPA: rhodanese-like domain-containing protein [Acidobacteriota bacterium]|jgi:glyoxylase-like metal-dependent hydrolase (beta-lactamase superfamily II)
MYFKQFYLGCLAHASYLIGSEGEGVVVDPQRDVQQYLEAAGAQGLQIKYVIETHLHADFVSGHREIASRTGARVVFGSRAGASFEHIAVRDGEELRLGKVVLRFFETPGHTPESISILVIDTEAPEAPGRVLTGDTLFIGDIGRPDLVGSRGYDARTMAAQLYDSLHEKLMKLDDRTEVYPAHGAGSLCGRNISRETVSTIGEQRRFNYALKPMSREEFVHMMTTDMPEIPKYFPKDAELNRTGARALDELPRPDELSAREFAARSLRGHEILDVRAAAEFGAGYIPKALNIGLGGQFASWAGTMVQMGTPILIVSENLAQVDEAVMRLARVGIDTVQGFLDGGIYSWDKEGFELNTIPQITVDELQHRMRQKSDLGVVDVRRPAEFKQGHVPGAVNIQLADLGEKSGLPDRDRPTAVICAGGYRSSIATSVLARYGFRNLFNVVGGTSAWINAGYAVE